MALTPRESRKSSKCQRPQVHFALIIGDHHPFCIVENTGDNKHVRGKWICFETSLRPTHVFFATHSQNFVFLEGHFGVNRKHWGTNSHWKNFTSWSWIKLAVNLAERSCKILQASTLPSQLKVLAQCVSVALFIRFISQRAIVNPIFLKWKQRQQKQRVGI